MLFLLMFGFSLDSDIKIFFLWPFLFLDNLYFITYAYTIIKNNMNKQMNKQIQNSKTMFSKYRYQTNMCVYIRHIQLTMW